jgi:hypothetical protein
MFRYRFLSFIARFPSGIVGGIPCSKDLFCGFGIRPAASCKVFAGFGLFVETSQECRGLRQPTGRKIAGALRWPWRPGLPLRDETRVFHLPDSNYRIVL